MTVVTKSFQEINLGRTIPVAAKDIPLSLVLSSLVVPFRTFTVDSYFIMPQLTIPSLPYDAPLRYTMSANPDNRKKINDSTARESPIHMTPSRSRPRKRKGNIGRAIGNAGGAEISGC